jgi:hypothetical protein
MKNEWDVDAAIATYNVDGWGGGYFTVNPTGNVVVRPLQENGGTIDILEVVNEARNRGLSFPAGHPISGFASAPCRIGKPRISRGDNRVRLQE